MSMGMVSLNQSGHNGADVVKDASIALKRAKGLQRGSYSIFTREMGSEIRERSILMQHLHQAFDAERLYLMYQPQINLDTRKVVGFEALLRWRTDDGKMISPVEFIPLAEHSGLIVSLGAWVLRTSCNTMAHLLAQGFPIERMAVNVSGVQFRQPDFFELVQSALKDSGLEGRHLELELTESITMAGNDAFDELLKKLRSLNIQIAIDDFGTGFSSLSYLDKLPVDRLKIDRSFVMQIDSIGGPRIAELIIQLGKKLGLQVIAEGIETEFHWNSLKTLGCHEGQGFLMARPMLESGLEGWLSEWNGAA